MASETINFRPKARLLLQLGDQLIRNEAVALFELVKNSYDANASHSTVSFHDINDPSKGQIVIEDDGEGMDLDIVANVWMQPGTDNKEKIIKRLQQIENYDKRLPIGEKGIGRFGAYKLGNTIEIISKKRASQNEIYFKIDWSDFEGADFLDDVEVHVAERALRHFGEAESGTKIIISNLRTVWTRTTYRETIRLINTLSTPIESEKIDSFRVDVKENLGWGEGLLDVTDIINKALFRAKIIFNGDKIQSFTYKFTPWDTMTEMRHREKNEINIDMREEVRDENDRSKKFEKIDLSQYKIGRVTIYFYAYSFDPNILKLGIEDKEGFKRYVAQNSGVKVYREGLRVYDYGEKTNDWLGLDIRRVNKPAITISNNQLIGYVLLKRAESGDLIEKSNREGFVENLAYSAFQKAVTYALELFEIERNLDKEKLNNFYVSKTTKEPVIRRLSELKETVDSKIKDAGIKQEIQRELVRIEDEYNEMVETFLKSANAGISLGVAIHEIDKIVAELNKTFNNPSAASVNHAKELSSRLTELVRGYSFLLRGKDKGVYDLTGIIKQALFNVDFRLKSHGIQLITDIDTSEPVKLLCSRSISIGSIINLLDNSIWWLEFKDIKNKMIYVGLSDELGNHSTVIVADNGVGYTIPTQDAIKPFIHGRPTGTGIGLGLFIANQCMEDQGGRLLFPDYRDFTIPEEFRSGAITAMAFRRKLK